MPGEGPHDDRTQRAVDRDRGPADDPAGRPHQPGRAGLQRLQHPSGGHGRPADRAVAGDRRHDPAVEGHVRRDAAQRAAADLLRRPRVDGQVSSAEDGRAGRGRVVRADRAARDAAVGRGRRDRARVRPAPRAWGIPRERALPWRAWHHGGVGAVAAGVGAAACPGNRHGLRHDRAGGRRRDLRRGGHAPGQARGARPRGRGGAPNRRSRTGPSRPSTPTAGLRRCCGSRSPSRSDSRAQPIAAEDAGRHGAGVPRGAAGRGRADQRRRPGAPSGSTSSPSTWSARWRCGSSSRSRCWGCNWPRSATRWR